MKSLELTKLEMADLCRKLALLMHSGLTAGDALNMLAEEEAETQLREILTCMTVAVDGGAYLSQAFEEADCFPAYMTGLVQVGERVGRLEETLNALADYYQDRERMERQLVSSLTYPAILLLMMAVVIIVLLSKVLPVFNDVYASLGGKLTGMAGALLLLGQKLAKAMPVLCVLLSVAVAAAVVVVFNRKLRKKTLLFWQSRWGDRGFLRKINNARFAQALSMGYTSGMPLEDAVNLATVLLKDVPPVAERCQKCSDILQQGGNLAEALEAGELMPPSICRLLVLGLRSGTGDGVMEDISRRMQNEVTEDLERMVARVEPAMVLITSVMVGMILLSVMLPLMNIMTAIG